MSVSSFGRRVWEVCDPDRACDSLAVEFLDCRNAIQHEQLRALDVIWRKRGVGRATRQRNLAPARVDNVAFILVAFDDSPDVADIMRQTSDDEVRIIGRRRRHQQCTTLEDVVSRQSDEHRMLNVVVEGIAVADAFEGQLGGKRDDFGQPRMGGPEPILHIGGQERTQRFCRHLG
jgi:hypothetical protein